MSGEKVADSAARAAEAEERGTESAETVADSAGFSCAAAAGATIV